MHELIVVLVEKFKGYINKAPHMHATKGLTLLTKQLLKYKEQNALTVTYPLPK